MHTDTDPGAQSVMAQPSINQPSINQPPTNQPPTNPPARSQPYRELYDVLARRQKPGPGVPAYTRWPNRAMARAITPLLFKWGLSPNLVTVISMVVSGAGMAVLIATERSWITGILAAVLLAAGFVLDSADGQLARLSGKGGPAGEWFDHVADAIRTPALHLSVAIGLHISGSSPLWVVVAMIFAVMSSGQFMSQILAEQLRKNSGSPAPAPVGSGKIQSWILLPTDTGTMCWVFVIWGFIGGFEVIYALLCAITIAHSAISLRRRFTQLRAL